MKQLSNFAKEFKGKTIVITGATGALGSELAETFAAYKANLVLVAKSESALASSAKKLLKQTKVTYYAADFANTDSVLACLKRILTAHRRIYSLINAVGVNNRMATLDISPEDFEATMRVNTISPFLFCQHIGKQMRKHTQGSIINIGSVKGFESSFDPSYGASKAALTHAGQSLSKVLAQHGVRVNTVAPGMFDSAMTQHMSPDDRATYERAMHIRRFATAHEIAPLIIFLAGSQASFITGSTLSIDGGYKK